MAKRVDISDDEYLKGLHDVVSNLQGAVNGIKNGSGKGLADGCLEILGIAVERAPVDTGDLRGSGFLDLDGEQYAQGEAAGSVSVVSSVPENTTEALLGFNAPYAAGQHEHTEYDHPRGGQPKYLESAIVENQDRLLALIAGKAIEELFGGGDDA